MRWRGRSFAGTRPFRATEAFSTTRLIIRTCTWRWPPSTWSVVEATRHSRRPLLRVVSTRGGPTHTSCRLSLTTSAIVPDLRPRSWKKLRRFPRTTLGSAYELARRLHAAGDEEAAKTALRKFYSMVEASEDSKTRRLEARHHSSGRVCCGSPPASHRCFHPLATSTASNILAQGAYEKAIAAFNEGRATRPPERH